MDNEREEKRKLFLEEVEACASTKVRALALVWDMQDMFVKDSDQYQALEQAQSLLLGVEIDVPDFDAPAPVEYTDTGYAIGNRSGYFCPAAKETTSGDQLNGYNKI